MSKTKTVGTAQVLGAGVVKAQVPGSRSPHLFEVTRAQDGTIIFTGDRTTGVINFTKKKFYYNSRGNSTTHRRHAKEVEVAKEFVKPFVQAAKLSETSENIIWNK